MENKLIIVEGIPGSGKSTASEMIYQYLKDHQVPSVLYQEGNTEHPADFEGVACLSESQYEELLRDHNEHVGLIHSITEQNENDYFIHYLRGMRKHNETFPDSLFNRLEQFDVYALPIEKYCELILERWTNFANQAEQKDEVTIFECCFLQNPLNTLLARDNRPIDEIKSFMIELAQIIKMLNPIIIYYYQDNVRETIDRVRVQRSKEWFDFITWYFTGQEFGKAHSLDGADGVVTFLQIRKELELDILQELDLRTLLLNNSDYDWEARTVEIQRFLKQQLSNLNRV